MKVPPERFKSQNGSSEDVTDIKDLFRNMMIYLQLCVVVVNAMRKRHMITIT